MTSYFCILASGKNEELVIAQRMINKEILQGGEEILLRIL